LPDKAESALRVRPGCATPEPPQGLAARTSARHRSHPSKHYVDGILSGHRTILAQAITLVESSREADRELAEQIIEECLPKSGGSIRVGITGVPGAGKSSVIEVLGTYLIREHGQKVAVLAIDPSSQLSGGSILGDKTRMNTLGSSDMAFIRPTPARGTLGGVAQRTREAMLLCEAAGYNTVFIETVGVGQSEIAVHEMVDFFLLIMLAACIISITGCRKNQDSVKEQGAAVLTAEGLSKDAPFIKLNDAISRFDPKYLVMVYKDTRTVKEIIEKTTVEAN